VSVLTSSARTPGLLAALVLSLVLLPPAHCRPARSIGILVAPVGDGLCEIEATYADALVGELVALGLRAAFLHGASPMLRAYGARLPSVAAADDWTPLNTVLGRLADRLDLDYVALVSVWPAGEDAPAPKTLLVVRGGVARAIPAPRPAADATDTAAAVAERISAAIDDLGEPTDAGDEPIVAVDPRAVAAGEPAEGEPVVAADVPGDRDEDARTPTAAEQPAATPAREAGEGENADPLAPARQAYERGDHDRAAALIRHALEEAGPSADLYLLRAHIRIALHSRDDAAEDLRRAVALDPELVEARVWLARLLDEMGLWQSAIEHYEQAVAADPSDLEALLGLGRVYRDHGHRRKAVTLLTDAAHAGQSDPALLTLLADLHELEGQPELAERYLLQASSLTTGEGTAAILERLGDLYARRRRHRDALACYLRAAELSPSRAAMVQRRYLEVMAAADGSVHDALTSGWSILQDYADDGIGEREMVYRRLSEVRMQLEEAMHFADSVRPPDGLRAEHARRRFAYSLAVEATVAALSYLDLGDEAMKERADLRHRDALAEFNALQGGLGR